MNTTSWRECIIAGLGYASLVFGLLLAIMFGAVWLYRSERPDGFKLTVVGIVSFFAVATFIALACKGVVK